MSKNLRGTNSKISKYFYANGQDIYITGGYYDTDPEYVKNHGDHTGYDYRAREALPLVAPLDAEVVRTMFESKGYGTSIHLYLPALNVTLHFAHLSKILVKKGDNIEKGTQFALTGNTGNGVYHLHVGGKKGLNTTMTKLENGKWTWIDIEKLNFDVVEITEVKGTLTLTSNVNERKDASTDSKIIATRKKGDKLKYVGRLNSGGYVWYKLSNGNYMAQREINGKVFATAKDDSKLKTNREIADEVKLGRWGNGADRVNRLTAAGYDAKAIQAIVDADKGETDNKPKPNPLKVGDVVSIKLGAVYQNRKDNKKVESWASKQRNPIVKINGDKAHVGGNINSWLLIKDLVKV